MRLIDADAICREIARKRNKGELYFSPEIELMLIDIIMEQPTAYDVEKVVEKLERCQLSNKGEYKHLNIPIVKAVDIVKEGGVDGK